MVLDEPSQRHHAWTEAPRWVTHIGSTTKRRTTEHRATDVEVWGEWEHRLYVTLDDGTLFQLEKPPAFDLGGKDVILLKHRSVPSGFDYFLVPVDRPETRTAIRFVRAGVTLAQPPLKQERYSSPVSLLRGK